MQFYWSYNSPVGESIDLRSQINTPVLIIGFNRPDKIEQSLSSLLESGVTKVYVSLDGPRNLADSAPCRATRAVVENFSVKMNLKIVWREYNLGCNLGVVAALDWFFDENEVGIILEDDCLPEKSMFEIFEANLGLISMPGSNIGVITAHNPFMTWPSEQVSDYVLIQGWATSARIWKQIRKDFYRLNFPQISKLHRANRSISESIFWWANSTRARLGTIDTWDGIFYDRMWRLGLKTWVPAENQITNSGFDHRATHTKNPFGSIFVNMEEKEKIDFDRALRSNYFKIKRRHVFTAPIKVCFDFFRGKFKKFEYLLTEDVSARHHFP
jgi:hypothetical protein